MKKYMIALATLAILGTASPALAKGKTPPITAPEKTIEQSTNKVVERIFNETEKAIIEEYLGFKVSEDKHDDKQKGKENEKGKGAKGLPPGLAKKDHLPPGLAMQLERNGRLPPGLEKRDLPEDLLKRLPKPLHGTRRIMAGNDILLIDEVTETILDIIKATGNAQ